MADHTPDHSRRHLSFDASCGTYGLRYDQPMPALIPAVVGSFHSLLSCGDASASFQYREYFRSCPALAFLASRNGTGTSVAALGCNRVYHAFVCRYTVQNGILSTDRISFHICFVPVRLDLFDLIILVQQIAETKTVQEDRPGDIDPEEEEEYGTDTAVDGSIGLVVHDIEDKAAFGEIPDQ